VVNIHNTINTVTDRTVAGINLGYNVTSWLNLSYQLGFNNIELNRQQVTDIGSRAAAGTGEIVEDSYNKRELESNFLITFAKSIGQDMSVKAVFGHNVNQQTANRQAYDGKIIISPGYMTLTIARMLFLMGVLMNRKGYGPCLVTLI